MDFRAGLIVLCLLTVQAVCGPVRERDIEKPLNGSIQVIQKKIESMLKKLNDDGVLPKDYNCSLKFPELVRLGQQNLTAHLLSSFGCHMEEMSNLVRHLSEDLKTICQIMQEMENRWTGKTVSRNCSLPSFKQTWERYMYTKCLLEVVDERLSKAKF